MKSNYPPEYDRISVLVATILLAYALLRFIELPSRIFEFEFLGIYLNIVMSTKTVVSILVGGLTASGADWLIRQHPSSREERTIQHWVLPGLTAWVLGVILNVLPDGLLWWIAFTIGAGLLILVLLAEYIVVEAGDDRYPASVAGLTALSFALFLVLTVALRARGIRLILMLPALAIPIGLICLRFIHLRLQLLNMSSSENATTALLSSLTLTVVVTQFLTVFHYFPLSPLGFGLGMLGPAYALTNFLGNLTEGKNYISASIEPLIFLIGIWAIALWIK